MRFRASLASRRTAFRLQRREVPPIPAGFPLRPNRGLDTIAVLPSMKGALFGSRARTTKGKTPRGFGIDPSGMFLLPRTRSDSVVVFRIDPETGRLTQPAPSGRSPVAAPDVLTCPPPGGRHDPKDDPRRAAASGPSTVGISEDRRRHHARPASQPLMPRPGAGGERSPTGAIQPHLRGRGEPQKAGMSATRTGWGRAGRDHPVHGEQRANSYRAYRAPDPRRS
jgi:hypothetical protein